MMAENPYRWDESKWMRVTLESVQDEIDDAITAIRIGLDEDAVASLREALKSIEVVLRDVPDHEKPSGGKATP